MTLFCLLPSVQAQSIVGKWKCSKEYFKSMDLLFYGMKGYYKFNKDGTFYVKINGGSTQNIYIKISGTYNIADNRITTNIVPGDIYCYVNSGQYSPDILDSDAGGLERMNRDRQEYAYEQGEFRSNVLTEDIKNTMWEWKNEPLTITKKELKIGENIRLKKKRGLF
ncbi:hypothetical protein [Xylanibacter muris]